MFEAVFCRLTSVECEDSDFVRVGIADDLRGSLNEVPFVFGDHGEKLQRLLRFAEKKGREALIGFLASFGLIDCLYPI